MRVILVDDEPIAIEVLQINLSQYKDIEVVGTYTNPLEALKDINETKPDVIFLDIEMGSMCGLEMAEYFTNALSSVEIVFVTAYSEYAVEAFEINAIDYLLKPIQKRRFSRTIDRLRITINKKVNIEEDYLKINSFNIFKVLDSKGDPLVWRTKKSKELFAYIWLNSGKVISKINIIEDIFSDRDTEKANTLLYTTTYQLRKSLENIGYKNAIIYTNNSYKLNIPIKSDLDKLKKLLSLDKYNDEHIKQILEIYKGDLLEQEGYEWVLQLQQTYREAIFHIFSSYAKKQLDKKIMPFYLKTCLDKLFYIDPYNEKVIQMIIKYYGIQKNKVDLQKFFIDYEESIKEESIGEEIKLGLSSSTVRLYNFYMK